MTTITPEDPRYDMPEPAVNPAAQHAPTGGRGMTDTIDLTEALEAAARRFALDVTRPAWDDLPDTARVNMRSAMQPLITAALPHIKRQIREQVAREIEVQQGVLGLDRASVRTAARIARGEA